MARKSLLYEHESGVATIRFNRPETLNSLTLETIEEMSQALVDLDRDDSVRAVVITGTGRGFCSGGSFTEIIGPLVEKSAEEKLRFARLTCDLVLGIRRCRKPIVAAVNGPAVGGGASIALASDIRIVARSGYFAFLFVKVGLAGTGMGATYLLPRVVGLGIATDLLLTGRKVEAEEALRIGLASRVVPDDAITVEAREIAGTLASGPVRALGMTKDLLDRSLDVGLETALEMEARTLALSMGEPEFREGYRAFIEKRPPVFFRPD